MPTLRAPSATIVKTSHADIAVRQSAGRKLPVLLLHGSPYCKEVFGCQFDGPLGQQYRLIGMDLPGHGASGDAFDPERTYSMPGLAETAVEVLEQLGVEEVVVLGWSLGGHVGMEIMALYPDLVGLAIVGAPPLGRGADALRCAFRSHPGLSLAGRRSFSEEDARFSLRSSEELLEPILRAAVRRADGRARQLIFASLESGAAADQRELVKTSSIPLAVINGAEDPIVDLGYVQGLPYANLWRHRCHLIPCAGHAPFLEAPHLFNDLLARFLHRMEAVARHRQRHPALVYSG